MTNKIHPYSQKSSAYNFFFHPLHSKEKREKILAIAVNVILTPMTLGLWQISFWVVNRLDNKKLKAWKANFPLTTPTPTPTPSNQPKAKIYMSLTGNPTHLGHMMIVATAIDELVKRNICVDEVKISLSHESYLKSKVSKEQNKGIKKVALSQEAREHLLNGAIKESAKEGFSREFRSIIGTTKIRGSQIILTPMSD